MIQVPNRGTNRFTKQKGKLANVRLKEYEYVIVVYFGLHFTG